MIRIGIQASTVDFKNQRKVEVPVCPRCGNRHITAFHRITVPIEDKIGQVFEWVGFCDSTGQPFLLGYVEKFGELRRIGLGGYSVKIFT